MSVHLTRYFEREYKRLSDHPVSLQSLGISTDQGPMMEETEALMDSHYDERPEFFASFLDRQYYGLFNGLLWRNPEYNSHLNRVS